MRKNLLCGLFVLVFSLLNLLIGSLLTSGAYAASCADNDLPSIPFSVTPLSGTYKDEYTLTIKWEDLSQTDFNKYKNIDIRMEAIDREDPRKLPLTYSPDPLRDSSYLRAKKINQSYKFSGFFGLLGRTQPYIVDLHLVVDQIGISSASCKLESNPLSIIVTSNYVENPTSSNPATGLPGGSLCDPNLQTDPNFKCKVGSICNPSIKDGSATYRCSSKEPSWPSYADPTYRGECSSPDDRNGDKCVSVKTAIGNVSTNPAEFVKDIFSVVLGLAGGIALILIMLAGYKLIMSQGNAEQITAARDQLTSAIVGLLFIIFSFVILQVIGVDILRIPGFAP